MANKKTSNFLVKNFTRNSIKKLNSFPKFLSKIFRTIPNLVRNGHFLKKNSTGSRNVCYKSKFGQKSKLCSKNLTLVKSRNYVRKSKFCRKIELQIKNIMLYNKLVQKLKFKSKIEIFFKNARSKIKKLPKIVVVQMQTLYLKETRTFYVCELVQS